MLKGRSYSMSEDIFVHGDTKYIKVCIGIRCCRIWARAIPLGYSRCVVTCTRGVTTRVISLAGVFLWHSQVFIVRLYYKLLSKCFVCCLIHNAKSLNSEFSRSITWARYSLSSFIVKDLHDTSARQYSHKQGTTWYTFWYTLSTWHV